MQRSPVASRMVSAFVSADAGQGQCAIQNKNVVLHDFNSVNKRYCGPIRIIGQVWLFGNRTVVLKPQFLPHAAV